MSFDDSFYNLGSEKTGWIEDFYDNLCNVSVENEVLCLKVTSTTKR